MSRIKVIALSFAFTLLVAAALLARAPVARAESQPGAPFGVRSPSVVYQAFGQSQTVGTGPNRAALVVRYGDGGVQTRCVQFEEAEIGGDELLDRSGLAPVFGLSLEVCSINGEGCPSDDCFCRCPFPDCEYWAYYHWTDGAWKYSEVGASAYGVRNGAVEGWSWGPGDFSQGTPPPVMTFDQICNPQTTASPTPSPTSPSLSPPQIFSFVAQPASVEPGSCATLSWQVSNAATVLLDSETVPGQGSKQVCPTTTQTYTLIAANPNSPQASQQVTVQVTSAAGGTNPATATPSATVFVFAGTPTSAPVFSTPDVIRSGMPTPAYQTPLPRPIVTQAPFAGGAAGVASPQPDSDAPPPGGQPLIGGVPLAPTPDLAGMEQLPPAAQGPLPTPTRFELARPPTETPRPRRILGDGRPTPTPILVARAGGAPGAGAGEAQDRSSAASRDGRGTLVASRAFDDNLLPQYAAYLATVVILLAMGGLVHRRRNGQPAAVAQRVRERDAARGERLAGRDERAA